MGIPEDSRSKKLLVLPELRLRVEAAAGVVEVDLVLGVEPGVLARAQGLHGVRVPVRVGEAGRAKRRRYGGQGYIGGQVGHGRIIRMPLDLDRDLRSMHRILRADALAQASAD